MSRVQGIVWSLFAWLAVGAFWLVMTRSFHPTWNLALITTTSLVTAFAAASCVNHLVLIPRYLRAGHPGRYAMALLGVMVVFTGLALAILRSAYIRTLGPQSVKPIQVDFGIDLFGTAAHVLGAAGVVWAVKKFFRKRSTDAA